jgi:hypothetical protein
LEQHAPGTASRRLKRLASYSIFKDTLTESMCPQNLRVDAQNNGLPVCRRTQFRDVLRVFGKSGNPVFCRDSAMPVLLRSDR